MFAKKSALNVFALCLILLGISFSPVQARQWIAAPLGGGPGITALAADEAGPIANDTAPDWHDAWEDKIREGFLKFQQEEKSEGLSSIGGYDGLAVSFNDIRKSSLAVTNNGEIYLAAEVFSATNGYGIRIYQSTDDGNSFSLWGQRENTIQSQNFRAPSIEVAEGAVSRVYLAYTEDFAGAKRSIQLVYSDLGLPAAAFTKHAVMVDAGIDFDNPHITTDVFSFAGFYVYVVAEGISGSGGTGVYFARGTTQGQTWEVPYAIGTLSPTDRGYFHPRVAVGFGGFVHVAWDFVVDGTADDDAIRYRRCLDYGNGGLANWETMIAITQRNSGIWEYKPRIAASTVGLEVMIAYSRREWVNDSYFTSRTVGATINRGSGAGWETETLADGNMFRASSLLYAPYTGRFVLGGDVFHQAGFQSTSTAGSLNWTTQWLFSDKQYNSGYSYDFEFALNPSHSQQQLCVVWPLSNPNTSPDKLFFDAQWRADPGYPNYAPGFPVNLPAKPISDPVIVDLDGDGDLEILFTDVDTKIQAYHHDGSPVAGWPVDIGGPIPNGLYHSPVAVGDLNGDGQMTVVAANLSGQVYAFNPAGQVETGFPYNFPDNAPVFVSLGALGGHTPRTIICVGGNKLRYVDYRGELAAGGVGWNFSGQSIIYPAAVGDINGDGVAEIVIAATSKIYVAQMSETSILWTKVVPNGVSQSPSLADFDGDGDVEVVVPGPNGLIYGLADDGSDWPGFPVTVPSGAHVSSIALSQILGATAPELIFTTDAGEVEAYFSNGQSLNNYPKSMGAFSRHTPIVQNVDDGSSGDIIVGAEDQSIYAWKNFGNSVVGWPRDVGDWINRGAAAGNLDYYPGLEVVILSESQLMVFNVNSTANSGTRSWPMYGHDPARTGCLNCSEDLVSAVGPGNPDDALETRVSFAPPSPNPTNGPTLFRFNLSVRAAVSLDIYDLRGHRVRSVYRQEVPAGPHMINWNGRDDRGRSLASGVYFANLQVRGPRLNRNLTRKVNFLK